jgi:hypothetical protein
MCTISQLQVVAYLCRSGSTAYQVVTVIKACYSPKNRCGNYDVNVLNNDGTNFHVKLR